MTSESIKKLAVLVELETGEVYQVQTKSDNTKQHLMSIHVIEEGIRLYDKDYSDSIELEQP